MNLRSRPAALSGRAFDVLVIGGGITGAAIARECARRGMRTAVMEQNDFASGSTSRSTRIILGGLRHLEHGDIAHVRDSLRERRRLMVRSPHLVKPLHFLLALPRNPLTLHRSFLALRAGLWLSHLWSRCKQTDTDEIRAFEQQLDAGQEWQVYSFEDAQCEFPERLAIEWLLEAEAAGAIAINYMRVLKVLRGGGHVIGARVLDCLTGEETTVRASWVINATGPWADRVLEESNIAIEPMAEGVRGSHLLLPLFSGAPSYAVRAETPDGHAITVMPWNGQILVGSTRIPDSGDPGAVAPDSVEIEYLMNGFIRFFPGSGLTKADIRGSFAGMWPKLFGKADKNAGFGHKYALHEHGEEGVLGLISVAGGNLGTAALIARDVVRHMGLALAKPAVTYALAPSEKSMETALQHRVRLVAHKARIPQSCAHKLTEWYGRNALTIAQLLAVDARLYEPICSHTGHLLAEAVYAVQHEHAVTLADIVLRRVPVALGPCWSESCSQDAAIRIGAVLGWNKERTAGEFEDLEEERERFLHPRGSAQPVAAGRGTTAAEAA